MDLKKPVVVYVAGSNLESHLIVTMLVNHGIPAYAVEDQSGASLWMFGTISQFHKPKIYVEDTDVEQATAMIEQYEETERERRAVQGSDLSIEVVCEECGKTSRFSDSQRGTVQDCPHCGEYIDVEPPAWSEEAESSRDRRGTRAPEE